MTSELGLDAARTETLDDLLRAGLRTPDRPALIYHDEPTTFGGLDARVRRVAGGLRALGVGRGDRLAVWLPACPEWIEVYLAAARLGALVVAVNTRLRAPEVQDVLRRARPKALVMWPDFRNVDFAGILRAVDAPALSGLERIITVHGSDAEPLPLATVELDALRDTAPLHEFAGRPGDRTIVFASSGTTARPKLVAHHQRGVSAHAAAVARAYGYGDGDAVLMHPLPLCGTFGFVGLTACLHAGRPTVLMDVFDPRAANALVHRYAATHILAGDDMLRGMFEAAAPGELASLRSGFYGLFSGDAAELVTLAQRHGLGLSSGYGSTEVGALFTHTPAEAPFAQRAVTGGVPVHADAQVRVRDVDSGELAGVGAEGELEIRAPSMLDGLLDDPDRERERFTDDGFVRTGDIGTIAADGRLIYLRRAGDAMRLSGFLVSPREIEEALESDEAVHRAQVVQVTVGGAPRPFAFVVARANEAIDEAAVRAACETRLARFKAPVRVVELDALPLVASANGNKIDRRGLTERAQRIVDERGDA